MAKRGRILGLAGPCAAGKGVGGFLAAVSLVVVLALTASRGAVAGDVPWQERQALWQWRQGVESNESGVSSWSLLDSPCAWRGVSCDEGGRHIAALSLPGAALGGTLPPEFSFLTALRRLDLDGNALSGTLPDSWSTMRDLEELAAQDNRLEGTLPGAWSRMYAIRFVSLSNNGLSGPLPRYGT